MNNIEKLITFKTIERTAEIILVFSVGGFYGAIIQDIDTLRNIFLGTLFVYLILNFVINKEVKI